MKNLFKAGYYNFDFKPNNIMRLDGQLVVIDFDACIRFDNFKIGEIISTLGHGFYIKPDNVFNNLGEIDSLPKDKQDKIAQIILFR